MNVLFLSTWFPYPPDNGSRIRAFHLVRALARTHRVVLLGLRSAEDGREQAFRPDPDENRQVHSVPVDAFRHVGRRQLAKFVSPIPVAYWPSRQARQQIARVASSSRWDVIVAFQPPVACYALQLSHGLRVLDIDTSLSYQMRDRHISRRRPIGRLRTWLSWQKAHRYEIRLFRRFRICTVASPSELPHVKAMVGPRGHVQTVPNGVDCTRNRPGLAEAIPGTLVYNGALTYNANYDAMQYFLGEIYPLVTRQVPEVSLTITGSTAGVDVAGLGAPASVRLSGYVDDVRPVIACASVCVVPLRQGAGTRLKILEAMALGVPVVATSKGAEGLEVKHEHDIVIADEPAEFAAQVVRVLGDQHFRQFLTTNARRTVEERYDWVQIGERFVDLVEQAVREHVARGAEGR